MWPNQLSLTKTAADQVVSAVFSAIADSLARNETVTIAGFGTFATRRREARQGRNPQTGETVAIAASTAPSFKAGKALRDTIKAGTPRRDRRRPGGAQDRVLEPSP